MYTFCNGHALDIHLGYTTRPHGDIDSSAYWEDRNTIIYLDYIEFLFNKRDENDFIYFRNDEIQRECNKAILHKDGISYFAPELVLLYKSTDLTRNENKQDFDLMRPHLSGESREWLKNALITAFPDGYEWIERLEIQR